MKKTLIAFFACVLCFVLCGICAAEDSPTADADETAESQENAPVAESAQEEESELKEYITEKILPVIIGVATSSFGFVAVLGTISRSLKSLKDTKESFSSEAKKRQEEFEKGCWALEDKAQELSKTVSDVPELKDKLNELICECALLAEILTLGFSANTEIIKSGKGKKMSVLLENAKLAVGASPHPTKGRLSGKQAENSEKEVSANETL